MAEGARRGPRSWICGACGSSNEPVHLLCENCGVLRPTAALARQQQAKCSYDGEALRADGFCSRGGGYPVGLACAFACPHCRQPLSWDGGCLHCYGALIAADGAKVWTMPGDRYEFYDEHGKPRGDGRHWIFVAKGPRATYWPTAEEFSALQVMISRVSAEIPTTRQ